MLEDEEVELANLIFSHQSLQFDFQKGWTDFKRHQANPNAPASPVKVDLRQKEGSYGTLPRWAVKRLSQALASYIQDEGMTIQHIAGLPRAGEPYAQEVARLLGLNVLKLEKQGRSISPDVIGAYQPKENVLLLDNASTHGTTAEEATFVFRRHGLRVRHCLVVVDREQGALERLKSIDVSLLWLFRLTALLEFAVSRGIISRQQWRLIREYQASDTFSPSE